MTSEKKDKKEWGFNLVPVCERIGVRQTGREWESHLLQTGGVELGLINDLYSHLETKQERVQMFLHVYSFITHAAVGLRHIP